MNVNFNESRAKRSACFCVHFFRKFIDPHISIIPHILLVMWKIKFIPLTLMLYAFPRESPSPRIQVAGISLESQSQMNYIRHNGNLRCLEHCISTKCMLCLVL